MTSLQRFLNAAQCKPVDQTPVWLMRQAGRYLPEYRDLKEKHGFLKLVKTPELATEVTLQPLKRFPLDAAIIFSDILVIPEAMGQPYHFRDEGGIGMDYLLEQPEHFEALNPEAIPEKLSYVADALTLTRNELGSDTALLGFSGTPWTLACYMLEGGSAKNYTKVSTLRHIAPELFEQLMDKLTQAIITYLQMQIAAGADAIQLFDSLGSICQGHDYEALSLKYIRKIIAALPRSTPIILFAKNMAHHAEPLIRSGASVLSMDWTVQMNDFRASHRGRYALQGNLDPTLLCTTPKATREATTRILEDMSGDPGFIFNLGHGMLPQARIDCVETLLDTIHNYR